MSCLFRLEHYYKEALDHLKQSMDVTIRRLTTELETGGNIRFEDGKASDLWLVQQENTIHSGIVLFNQLHFSDSEL